MSAATGRTPYRAMNDHAQLPAEILRPLKANVAPYRGMLMAQNSAGLAIIASGSPNCISLGPATRDEDSASFDAGAYITVENKWVSGYRASSAPNDSLGDSDFGAVAWAADNQTPGKLSNYSGSNRSMLGLAFGLDPDLDATPRLWVGPVAWCVARAVHMADAKVGAWCSLADGGASAATSETAIHREKFHGVITAVEFTGAAVAASNADYVTVTVSKRNGSGGGATVLATYDSRAANQGAISAFQPASFALSAVAGVLNLLETDIITLTVAKGGAGQVLTGAIRIVQKVQ